MFTSNENAINYLKNKWKQYFGAGNVFLGRDYINGIPIDVYKTYLEFLICRFRQDGSFEYLYNDYRNYAFNKNNNGKSFGFLSKKEFENHLLDFDIKTYTVMDENYVFNKYVCYKFNYK